MTNKEKVYAALEEWNIPYRALEHRALFTAEDVGECVPVDEDTVVVKNLFLRNDTGSKVYLVSQCYHKHADLKLLRAFLKSSRLGFCSEERLQKYLGVATGSVSPLCALNDTECKVQVVLDADLANYKTICMHPNDNTGSTYLAYEDLLKFIEKTNHEPLFYKV